MVRDPVCGMELEASAARATAVHAGRIYYFCSEACRDKFSAQPEVFVRVAPGMRLTVGVMGSASADTSPSVKKTAQALGRAIAQQGFTLITGACPGLPYECARETVKAGGLSIGISPALSLEEHVHKYHSPSDAFDVLVYTGSGLMGREVTNIRSSDMVVIIGGRSGTLGEFAIAFDEGKLIGVLKGTGGITEIIPELIETFGKNTGSRVIYRSDPEGLIASLSDTYVKEHYRRPSCFCGDMIAASG